MSGLVERLRAGPPLLLDGGLGTLLLARGLPPGMPPERWVLEAPGQVRAAHEAWIQAGSEAVHACTFGANAVRLGPFGLEARHDEINRRALALARASGAPFVIADLGPTGEYLPPVGRADPGRWAEVFRAQVRVLAEEGADALHLETFSDLREALAALVAAREEAPGLPILASMTFDLKKRGFFTIMGDPLGPSLRALAVAGAVAVGANCSLTSVEFGVLAREALAALGGASGSPPLVLQPNAGQPRIGPDGPVYAQQAGDFARDMAALGALGVRGLGGCCGTDPGFIAALRARLAEGGA